MFPANPCSLCSGSGHHAIKCPELYYGIREPGTEGPTPTGPRGQDEDDE